MAQNPLIKRYLDAGMAFTQMTQAKAEAIVRDLVNTGEVQANGIEEMVNELLERSRRNTETLLELVRSEVRNQLVSLGLLDEAPSTGATGDSGVEQQIEQHRPPQRPPAPAADEATDAIAAQAAAGETSATAVAPAKAVPAKKASAVKKSAKKASAKKASAKKASAKKATGNKKASAKKAAAKKAGA